MPSASLPGEDALAYEAAPASEATSVSSLASILMSLAVSTPRRLP